MKVLRYAVVGGIATLVDYSLFAIFAKLLGYPYLIVGALSFTVATVANYLLSIRMVFVSGARFERRQEISAVFLVSTGGLILHQLLLYIGVEQFGIDMLLAKLPATGMVFFWNFGMRNYYVFRHHTP